MKLCTCFLLFRIFAYTNSSPPHTTKEDKDGVDLDLDGSQKISVDQNTKNISDKTTIGKLSRHGFRSPSRETFTEFLQEVIKILNTYDDNTFKDFIKILDKEIKKYHSKGYKYHELMKNDELRNFIDEKFHLIIEKSVPFVKDNINEVAENIENKTNDNDLTKLLNYINSVYKKHDRKKFQKVLKELKVFGSSNNEKPKNELEKIIRYSLWAIIFKPYTYLNDKEKKGLQKEIAVFLKQSTETPSPRFKTNVIRHKPAVNELNKIILDPKNFTTKMFQPITPKTKNPKLTTSQITTKNKRRSILKPNTNEEVSENEKTTQENSQDESDSQRLTLTFQSTIESSDETREGYSREISTGATSDEAIQRSSSEHRQHRKLNARAYDTLYIEDFYKTTEKPANIHKSEVDSKLETGISIEEYGDKLPAIQPNSKPRQRQRTSPYPTQRNVRSSQTTSRYLSDNDQNNSGYRNLRRSIAPPMPQEEFSVEVFERERKKRERALAKNYSFVRNNSIQHGLKDYVKRRKNLKKTINELKEIYENIQRSKVNVTTSKVDEVKDKFQIAEIKGQGIEDAKVTTFVTERQSNTHYARAQTKKNEITDGHTQGAVEKTKLTNKDLKDNIKESVTSDDRQTLKRKKTKTGKIKETTKATNTQNAGTENKYYTNSMTSKLYDLKSVKIPVFIELHGTAAKIRDYTETTHNTIKRRKIDNEI